MTTQRIMKKFKIRVPATTSNLGPGFDVIGAALKIYNELKVSVDMKSDAGRKVPVIEITGEGADSLPRNSKNIVWKSLKKVLDMHKRRVSIDAGTLRLKLINRIPLASGMGSSAAARLAGIMAGYKIAGIKPEIDEIISLGVKLEGHPDNIVPAILGGMCVCANHDDKMKYLKLPVPELKAVVIHPDFELSTSKSRRVLPGSLPLENAVFNTSRLALFMGALQLKRYDLLRYGMEDRIHQPHRSSLVPGMNKVFAAGLRAGAAGVSLSGAGPSIIALASPAKAGKVARAMIRKWKQFGISSKSFITDFESDTIHI
jgi:homoserine kinase